MRYEGKVWKDGSSWFAEVPILDIVTRARTKKAALGMMKDSMEEVISNKEFSVDVYPGKSPHFEVGSESPLLVALLLRRQREMRGFTLQEMAKRMGQKSRTGYARYEQGNSVPTTSKLMRMLKAVDSGRDFVLSETKSQTTSR